MQAENVAVAGTPRGSSLPDIERAVLRTRVEALTAGSAATTLPPSAMFSAVCEVLVSCFSLTSAGLVKRVAGQSRSFAWNAPGAVSPTVVPAKAQAWASSEELLEAASHLEAEGRIASAIVADDRLGLKALFYVESRRTLDDCDRALLDNVLRRMLCLPSLEAVS